MSLFKKAKVEADRLKMYIYGKTGTGKTRTALHFPNPAVIDPERGTSLYGKEFDFFVLETSDPKTIMDSMDELLADPGDFKTFVIDPITLVYDQIQRNREDYLKAKTGNTMYELQPLDYKGIKTDLKIFTTKLLSLDMNIIVTARSKSLYAPGKFMQEIGQQPDGPKDLPYLFDVVLELFVDAQGNRMARVEKDRTNKLPAVFPFTYDSFVQYLGMDALTRKANAETQKTNLNKLNERTTKITLDGEVIYTAGVTAETLLALRAATQGADPEKLADHLKDSFEVESMLDLSERSAKTLLASIIE